MSEVNTPKELYEYCNANGAENWRIIILKENEVDKPKGIWLVTERQEVLIVV